MSEKVILYAHKAEILYSEIEKRIVRPFTLLGDKCVGLRAILEDMFYEIPIKGNRDSWQLSGRMKVVADAYHLPQAMMESMHQLRDFCNAPAHHLLEISIEEYRCAVMSLSNCIHHLSGVPIPTPISDFIRSGKIKPIIVPKRVDRLIEFDRVQVVATPQDNNAILITCESMTGLGTYTLRIPKGTKDAWYLGERLDLIAGPIQVDEILHLFRIYIDSKDQTRASTYYESMIVVEPDYIIDASDIGKCFFKLISQPESDALLELTVSPYEVIINKFFKSRTTQEILKGLILGQRFASFIQDKQLDIQTDRTQEEIEHAWSILAWPTNDIDAMFRDIDTLSQTQFPQCDFRQPNGIVQIEETIISPRFGFQGRLDFIQKYNDEGELVGEKRTAYEFKSGAKPRNSDRMQAISYRTLIDALYPSAYGNSVSLIYLKSKEPIIALPSGARLLRSILFARNRLVREILQLAGMKPNFFKLCKEKGTIPTNGELNLALLQTALQTASEGRNGILSWHFVSFVAHVFRENKIDRIGRSSGDSKKTGCYSDLWNLPEKEKLEVGTLMKGLKIRMIDRNSMSAIFTRSKVETPTDFRKGDIVLILHGGGKDEKYGSAFHARKGSIQTINSETVVVRLNNPYGIEEFLEEDVEWEIEKDFMESNFNGMLHSLFLLLNEGGAKADRFLGVKAPRFKMEEPELDLSRFIKREPQLSESQVKAIRMGLKAEDLLLIKGPPGTGKTSGVLTELVFQIMKTTGDTVYLLAYTNPAVDNILKAMKKMLDEAQYLNQRIINISSSDKEDPLSLQHLVWKHGMAAAQEMARNCRIFVGTVAKYNGVRSNLPNSVRKDVVIIDEASQITDPMAAGLFAEFTKVILIGDQNQLPPVSKVPTELALVESLQLQNAGYKSYTESIFQRLWRQLGSKQFHNESGTDEARVELVHHFRMHQEIADLINPFYGGVLTIGTKGQSQLLPMLDAIGELEECILSRRIIFIDSPSATGRAHKVEADRVSKLIEVLRSEPRYSELSLDRLIGVISPWRKQVSLIHNTCHVHGNLRIDTVERFQGSESKNIILSMATSEERLLDPLSASEFEDGDLEIDRKLNVSLSRAEERLIILGEAAVLDGSKHYRKLINRIKEKGGFISNEQAEILFDEKDITK